MIGGNRKSQSLSLDGRLCAIAVAASLLLGLGPLAPGVRAGAMNGGPSTPPTLTASPDVASPPAPTDVVVADDVPAAAPVTSEVAEPSNMLSVTGGIPSSQWVYCASIGGGPVWVQVNRITAASPTSLASSGPSFADAAQHNLSC